MPELVFFHGPLDSGKSTLALQIFDIQSRGGRKGCAFDTPGDDGEAQIISQIGLSCPAVAVTSNFNFWDYLVKELTSGKQIDYLVCDSAHEYQTKQIDQLARVVDELQLEVFTFGLLTDFQTQLYPASKRLVELSDRIDTMPMAPLCWCAKPAIHNARTLDGKMLTKNSSAVLQTENEQQIAGLGHEVLCRAHHRRNLTAATAKAVFHPAPLPFGDQDPDSQWSEGPFTKALRQGKFDKPANKPPKDDTLNVYECDLFGN